MLCFLLFLCFCTALITNHLLQLFIFIMCMREWKSTCYYINDLSFVIILIYSIHTFRLINIGLWAQKRQPVAAKDRKREDGRTSCTKISHTLPLLFNTIIFALIACVVFVYILHSLSSDANSWPTFSFSGSPEKLNVMVDRYLYECVVFFLFISI